jgi:uncharacterized lipoprotein YmbA
MLPCSTRHILAVLSLALLLLEGCGSTPPTRFYVLPTLTDASPPAAAGKRELTIGIGPVTLPPYLDRPQIVTRASRVKLTLGEYDQWAASLQDSVARVLAENLSLLIPTDRVVFHPWPRQTAVDYQVIVEVTQFDRTTAGEVVLAARWSIALADDRELLLRKARYSAPAGRQEYEATVTAMSRTLEALSRDIAATIQTMAQQAPTR